MSVESRETNKGTARRVATTAVGVVTLLIGAWLAYGGLQLLQLGGSFYYLPAGVLMVVSGVLLVRSDRRGAWLFALTFALTLVWSLWEAGLHFWPLAARLGLLAVVGLLVALVNPGLRGNAGQVPVRRALGARPEVLDEAASGAVLRPAPA